MKILHTSDWHLGHILYNYDRTEEQLSMLDQMVSIVEEQKPDVFLLCGDVYHTSQPSAAIQTMLSEALVRIHDANPGMKKENMDEHIIDVPGKGYIVAIPYANERNFPEGFFQQLLDRVAEKNTEGLPVVMTAHTTVKGSDFTGHDHATDMTVGGIDSLELKELGEGYDYLALGHIHHGQFVHSGKHNVRYCGTPLPISFDENYSHSVSIVEIMKHGESPVVKEIEIQNPHPLVTLPTDGYTSWEEAKSLLSNFPDNIPAYIRLNVEIDDYLPVEANAEAALLTEGKQCRFCHINHKRKAANQSETKVMTVQEFQSEDPINIAKRYAEAMEMVANDSRNE